MAQSEVAVGIDLGTSYARVAVWKNGGVEVIAEEGISATPSVVAFTDTERLVGDAAVLQAAANPRNTVVDVMRLMGRMYSDRTVQADIKRWPFAVESQQGAQGDLPVVEVDFKGATKTFAPEEISAMVLRKLKETAESYVGAPVTQAVSTVPAYFNLSQRQATKDAASIAGFKLLRVVSAPAAVALAFGLQDKCLTRPGGHNVHAVLTFDLGGGTLDVALSTVEEGIVDIKATVGDGHLGGVDFDQRLVDHFAAEFQRRHKKDPRTSPHAMRRLRAACEGAKRALSTSPQTALVLKALHDGIDCATSITRQRFEELCGDLFRRCLDPVAKCLRDAKVDKSQVDEVVLVGGCSRIPKVQQLLRDFFNGKELNTSIGPDEAVVCGAAVQVAALTGQGGDALLDLLLLDMTPSTLGFETHGGIMTSIIPRNTTIPTKKECVIDRFSDQHVKVYEGERAHTKHNVLLGQIDLSDMDFGPANETRINLVFDVDASSTLGVQVRDSSTDRKAKFTIARGSRFLSQQEVERMTRDAERCRAEEEAERARAAARASQETQDLMLRRVAPLLQDEHRAALQEALGRALEDVEHKRKELQDMCDAVGAGGRKRRRDGA